MCKEIDETSTFSAEKSQSTQRDTQDQIPENVEIPYPREPPKEIKEEIIPLPDHSCGVTGDPLRIQSLEKLVDLDLSDI